MGVNRHVKLTLRGGGEQWCPSKLYGGRLHASLATAHI
jgi:hypothetical protein